MKKNNSLSVASELLFKLVLFLAVFDGVRSWTTGGTYFSFLKELTTFSLLLLLLIRVKFRLRYLYLDRSNLYFVLYIMIVGTIFIIANDTPGWAQALGFVSAPNGYVVHFKTIESFVVILIFFHYKLLTGREINGIIPFFVKLCVAYVIFTLVFYFVIDFSFLFNAQWWGRISLGYPTSDAQILCFGFLCLLFADIDAKPLVKTSYAVILIVGILISATGTSLLTLSISLLYFFFISVLNGNVQRLFKKRSVLYVIVLAGIVFVIASSILASGGENIDHYVQLLETKFNSISSRLLNAFDLGGSQQAEAKDASFAMREYEKDIAFSRKDDVISLIFGGPISVGTIIESQNFFLIRSYGAVGALLYYLWILSLLLLAIRNLRNNYGKMLFMGIGVLLISNLSTITTYLFGVTASFALVLAYCLSNIDYRRESLLNSQKSAPNK